MFSEKHTTKMPSRFQEMLKAQRENEETSRAGLKWESDEDDKLMRMVNGSLPMSEIAKTLQRTEGSIKTRLVLRAIEKMEKDNTPIETVSKMMKVSETDITEYVERKALRDEKKQRRTASKTTSKTNVSNSEIYRLLVEINTGIQTLLSKH